MVYEAGTSTFPASGVFASKHLLPREKNLGTPISALCDFGLPRGPENCTRRDEKTRVGVDPGAVHSTDREQATHSSSAGLGGEQTPLMLTEQLPLHHNIGRTQTLG
jgi:hypothetical protein